MKLKNRDTGDEGFMALSMNDSPTAKLFIKEYQIRVAKRMFKDGYDKQKILEILELSEKEFDKEVVNKIK
jgi:hypothetical protein